MVKKQCQQCNFFLYEKQRICKWHNFVKTMKNHESISDSFCAAEQIEQQVQQVIKNLTFK